MLYIHPILSDTSATMGNWPPDGSNKSMLLIASLSVVAIVLYVASWATRDALGKTGFVSPGRRAFAHWIPIAAATLMLLFMKRAELAMAVIFSTSVGCLSLVLGSVVIAEPENETPHAWRSLWPFVLPAGLLALLAGLAGRLSWIHAVVFLLEGMVILGAWRERSESYEQPTLAESLLGERRRKGVNPLNLALSILLVVIAAMAAVYGSLGLVNISTNLRQSLVVPLVLSPLLVIPMLLDGAIEGKRGRPWVSTTTGVGVVLLNLCLLLPAVVLLWYPVSAFHGIWYIPQSWRFDSLKTIDPLIYPMITWRVDTVVVVVLGFILLPVSLGRWKLGRAEGLVLIAIYAVYVLMETAASIRLAG
jgi:Ca2+/Na+ antiporter